MREAILRNGGDVVVANLASMELVDDCILHYSYQHGMHVLIVYDVIVAHLL